MGNFLSQNNSKISSIWLENPNWWFNASLKDDQIISDNFRELLENDFNILSSCYEESIDKVLFCDQIVRHIRRNQLHLYETTDIDIDGFLNLAVKEVNHGLKNNFDLNLSPVERCFYLLPLRHTREPEKILFAIKKIESYNNQESHPMYLRFLKASLKSYRRHFKGYLKIKDLDIELKLIEPILENHFTETNFELNDPFVNKFREYIDQIDLTDRKIISVSGGVDSMVLLYLMVNLEIDNLIVANIDYTNRSDSILETSLVAFWCNYLKIPFYCRQINEIKRKRDNLRNFYEEYTKKIRFDLYKDLINEKEGSVYLGHNYDDAIENVIRNISQKKNYNNLLGMNLESNDSNLTIIRPFLYFEKKEIVDYARKQGIPYTKDSTPKWCQRGKIRDQVKPFLNSFDPNFIPGLMKLSKHIGNLTKISKEVYYKPMFEKIIFQETIKGPLPIDNSFTSWRILLNFICKKKKIPIFSVKSIKNLIIRIENFNGTNNKVILSKTKYLLINDNSFEIFNK